MHVLMIHLKQETHLRTVASLLMEMELFDTAILDGEGVENIGVSQEQLFGSFQDLFGRGDAYNRTLCCPVKDPATVKTFAHLCEQQGIDFKQPDTGWVLSFPCDFYIGPEADA